MKAWKNRYTRYYMYKLIVAGARTVNEYSGVTSAVDVVVSQLVAEGYEVEIVSGHALGVDQYGEKYAQDNDLDLVIMPANWKRYGKSAGYKRNKKMAEYADGLVAIKHNNSKGTQHMIDLATGVNLKVWVFEFKG